MASLEVEPAALLDAARVLYSSVRLSCFDAKANPQVGSKLSSACDMYLERLTRAGITRELVGLARALELASGTYLFTEDAVADMAAGRVG